MEEKLKPINSTIRKADDNIYLNENRYEKPKEVFKELVKIARQEFDSQDNKVFLDAGCATGELIWYGKSQFPQSAFTGLDVSPEMIKSARRKLTDCNFFVGSVLDSNIFKTETFDAITCSGVLSIFDDQKIPIQNMISWLKPGGHLLIYTIVNQNPVDMIMRYRDVTRSSEPWEAGWNVFSKKTFDKILRSVKPKVSWNWNKFNMPFPLERQKDPMRTWTINTEDNPCQLINGAGQLIDGQILHVQKPA